MRILRITIGFVCCSLFFGCGHNESPKAENITPPLAKKEEKILEEHGNRRIDDYYWLSNPKDSAVMALLDTENAYSSKMLKHTEGLQNKLFEEINNRQDDQSEELPTKQNGYWHYRRFEPNQSFPLICRKKEKWDAPEEIVLNVPELAKKYAHFELSDVEMSPDGKNIAYLVDSVGERRHTLFIKNIATGKNFEERIPDVSSQAVIWANDSKTFYYVLVDETIRGFKVMRHTLGTKIKNDKVVFEEKDKSYVVALYKSRSQKYIFIACFSYLSTEYSFVDANKIEATPTVVQVRQPNLQYQVEHYDGNEFFIQNNYHAPNDKLSIAPLSNPSLSNWEDIVSHSDSSLMEKAEVLKNYIIIQDKVKGLNKIRILNRIENSWEDIDLGDEAYVAEMSLADYDNFALDSIRFNYQSLSTPPSSFSYDLKTRTKTILQQAKVPGYNIAKYESKRVWIKVRDSVEVPLSIVYRKDLFLNNGSNPLLLYAYGSYGLSSAPHFQSNLVSLLDRGFVYCIAHVRGGQELGRKWYDDGKLLKKKNSFNDYVDCAEFLVQNRFTNTDRLFAMGARAGGMLTAAAINMRPDLFKGVIAELPWTDVVTDMLDESLPLTTIEYVEWGNPKHKTDYDYMLSWSPYDNVKPANYPAVFAFANLNNSQVPYYSPAKWVQKLRANNTGKNLILFYCDKGASISPKAGRFDKSRLLARQYAFMLDLLGLK